jgi:diguanylate cyclase (GGDEF)-like protein/PAS domain S-box-containing protein
MILLLIVAVTGWFATDYLGRKARQEIIGESRTSLLTVSVYVSSTLTNIEGAAESLAGSPWIIPALVSKRGQDIEHANSVLDRYNSAVNASVSYLMDAEGMTVASSNRKDPDSFVGVSYLFRPYFQEAVKGRPGRHFAVGITSGKRGFYASYPVQDHLGKVLGVVTMKKDLDDMEGFFGKYPFCFLVNPNGIIFLSSSPAMVLRSLYPLDKAAREQLIASRQFGNKLPDTVFFEKEIADGMEVTLEGKDYIVSRKVIDRDGWSIVLLIPTDHIRIYKLTGILATVSLLFLIMIFSGIIYFTGRAREVTRQSEERYRMAIEFSNDGVALVEGDHHVYVNQAFLNIFGYEKPEDVVGKTPFVVVHPDDLEMVMENSRRRQKGESAPSRYEFKGIRKDGTTLYIDSSVSRITYHGKSVSLAYLRDITDRKQTETALSESEERFRKISTSARDAIIMMDSHGAITYWNEAAERIFDHTSDETIGKELHTLLAPQKYYQSSVKGLDHFVKTGEGNAVGKTLELSALRKDGTEFPIELSLSAAHLQDGWSAIGVLRDITNRKQAEKALQESEQKFRTLFEDSMDAIYITTKEGRFIDFNQAYLELFGYTKEEMVTLHAKDTYLNPDDRFMFTKMMEEKGSVKDYDIKLRKKGGQEMECLMTATVKHADDGSISGYQGIIRDITERKYLEQQLHTISLTDELTGLYNRRGFITLSEQQLKIAVRTKKDMLLFFVDLDKMKQINDTLGHREGDKALVETAAILRETFRGSDVIGRMGGDEFAVLAIDADDETREVVVNRLHKTLDERNRSEGRSYTLSLSVGIAHHDPEKPCSLDELMVRADTLMYEEKRNKQH